MSKSRILVAVLTLSVAALSVAIAGAGETAKPNKKAKTVKLTVNKLPPLVLTTLQEQVGDGEIVEVKKKTKKGLVVYHADVLTHGNDWEIDVLEDGTLPKKGGKKSVNKGADTSGKPCADDCDGVPGKGCPVDCEYLAGQACTIQREAAVGKACQLLCPNGAEKAQP